MNSGITNELRTHGEKSNFEFHRSKLRIENHCAIEYSQTFIKNFSKNIQKNNILFVRYPETIYCVNFWYAVLSIRDDA